MTSTRPARAPCNVWRRPSGCSAMTVGKRRPSSTQPTRSWVRSYQRSTSRKSRPRLPPATISAWLKLPLRVERRAKGLSGRTRREGATAILAYEAVKLVIGVFLAAKPLHQVPEDKRDKASPSRRPHHSSGDLLVDNQRDTAAGGVAVGRVPSPV